MDLDYFRDLNQQYWDWPSDNFPPGTRFPGSITLQDIVNNNSSRIITAQENQEYQKYFKYPEDAFLAQYFPIIGSGTQSLVFDISLPSNYPSGKIVLKRWISDGRGWEMSLDRMAKKVPGLYSEVYDLPILTQNNLVYFVQEKLVTIGAKIFRDLILKTYPELLTPDWKYANWETSWEWGVDQNGIPHVYDWG